MVKTYLDFITHFPTDAYSPDYLFKAAEISMNLNQNEKAIELFLKLHDFYPNCVKAPFALYLAGFVSENKLYDTAMARKYYNQLIAQYPDKPIANDAKNTLKNLGKTDEQIVRDFEKAQMNVSNKKEKK